VITWPSRDAGGVPALLRHGFAPLAVVAARTARPPRPTAPADPQIRRAGPADVEAVTALGVQLVRYDAQFGGVVERPETEAGLRTECEKLLAEPEPWVWLAERDGEALGVLIAERPERATWIAPLARPAPVAYLQQGFVRSGLRGAGLGARLTEHFHAAADAAGVAVTLLHYAQVNPLSVPFWSQQGYRPLRTSWEVRPARRL
jgi:GNAT superfamily N-acetyltransferase